MKQNLCPRNLLVNSVISWALLEIGDQLEILCKLNQRIFLEFGLIFFEDDERTKFARICILLFEFLPPDDLK